MKLPWSQFPCAGRLDQGDGRASALRASMKPRSALMCSYATTCAVPSSNCNWHRGCYGLGREHGELPQTRHGSSRPLHSFRCADGQQPWLVAVTTSIHLDVLVQGSQNAASGCVATKCCWQARRPPPRLFQDCEWTEVAISWRQSYIRGRHALDRLPAQARQTSVEPSQGTLGFHARRRRREEVWRGMPRNIHQ